MNGKRKNNWLHLDLKGAIPSVGKLLEQLEWEVITDEQTEE